MQFFFVNLIDYVGRVKLPMRLELSVQKIAVFRGLENRTYVKEL